ncbi:MAG: phosphoribosyl-ATP diphosphatase [Burkholderiales bacterium]
MSNGNDTLAHLAEVIAQRRATGTAETSYVARLFAKGTDAMLKKVGEEATEVVMAAKDGERGAIVAEVADLWFHTMLVLAAFDLRPADVLAELERREGLSGLEEFAARKAQQREDGGV